MYDFMKSVSGRALRVIPGGNKVDGLPPVPSFGKNDQNSGKLKNS